jgi:hypothetical protein
MARRDHARKGSGPIPSKQDRSGGRQIHVTNAGGEAQNVTHTRRPAPRRCYEKLEPWLRFANLPEDAQALHDEYVRQFAPLPTGMSPQGFFTLTVAVRQARMQGCESRGLIEAHKEIREFLERIPAMEPRESGRFAADEEVLFPMIHWANRAENGRIYFQPEPLRWAFMKALEGAETCRFRRCPICDKFFYALRIQQQACSQRCNATRRVRAWREKQHQYEYARYRKLESGKIERKPRPSKGLKENRR